MATLQGQEIKNTYQSLLKTENNTSIDSTLQTITDGQGNATALSLSTDTAFIEGTISNNLTLEQTNFYLNNGGTSGSEYFLYNSANKSIYLNAWAGDYAYEINSSLTDVYYPGLQISFVHTELGLLTGIVESSYFYDGEYDPLTIITLTTDPSNGINDTYGGIFYPPNVYFNSKTYSSISGLVNTASFYAHAEGYNTTAAGTYSHAEGTNTQTVGAYSHVEGNGSKTIGQFSHAEGIATTSIGPGSHTEGNGSKTVGSYTHSEGVNTTSIGQYSHVEGAQTTSVGQSSHAEGTYTITIGESSHAEGYYATSIGVASHAEGSGVAIGQQSHAEGGSVAAGDLSHAEGTVSTSTGYASHAEGVFSTSVGFGSHAEGIYTVASGSYDGNVSGIPQHAEGRFNIPDVNSLLIVGNGTADNARSNAFTVTTFGTSNATGSIVLQQVSQSLNFANDTAAAGGGVPLGGLYHTSGIIKIRLV